MWASGGGLGAQAPVPAVLLGPSVFEAQPIPGRWELNSYGAAPSVEADAFVRRASSETLRLSAAGLSDTAIAKEVTLAPRQWHCFSAWIKTRALEPADARTLGTLQVQTEGGRRILATGRNHAGDTAWTQEHVYFRSPSEGRVRLCLFLAGFGKATGTAWFAGVSVAPADVAVLPIRITPTAASAGSISPLQYGQFIEYLCDLVPGMWSEKLYDGSFEGLSPYKFEFVKETDFREKPWYPSGEVNCAEFSLDPTNKVSGAVSRKIEIIDGSPTRVGLAQDGIALTAGAACDFSCWLRAEEMAGPVRVSLRQEEQISARCAFEPSGQWQRYTARLMPKNSAVNATLAIEFSGRGKLWLDNASLMPVANVGGWRPDVVEAVRALKPGVIRFGGSILEAPSLGDFDWKQTIGEVDRRRPIRAWGGLQPVGPGLEEIVQFCQTVGAEPLICVRFTGRSPKDAAEQVEYFNGAANTPMGAWRARNGHREPYRIKYWQVANEQSGPEYENGCAAFCRAMKAVDPSIVLLSSFPSARLIQQAGSWLDYVAPHHYSHDLVWMENDLDAIQQMIRENGPPRGLKIAVTEWNTTAGDVGPHRAMLWTLANALACSRYHNLLHRHCDVVELANRSNLINSFCSGILQTDNHRLYKTPTYYAQQLYATLAGSRALKIDTEVSSQAGLDLSATLSADGSSIILFAVNDTVENVNRPVDYSAFGAKGQPVSIWTLGDTERAGDKDVTNSFARPERIAPVTSSFAAAGARFDYCFPALALTVLKWTVR